MNNPHSPEFIAEMKEKLLTEKQELEGKLGTLSTRRHGDYQSNFPDYGRNEEENASEVADFEVTHSTTETLEERMKSITEALERIESGSYGVTIDEQPIPEDRLRANPAATTLVTK